MYLLARVFCSNRWVFCTVCSSTVMFTYLYYTYTSLKLHFETAWALNCNMILCFVKQCLKKSVTSNEKLIIENDKMLFPYSDCS